MCIHLEVDGTNLVEPWEAADAFAEKFQSVCNNPRPAVFPFCSLPSWVFITRFSFWFGYFQSRYTSKTIYIQSVGILGLLNEAVLEFLCLFHIYFQPQVTSTEFSSVMKASDTYSDLFKKCNTGCYQFQFIYVLNNCSILLKFIRPIYGHVFSI
jgi:hypothetical protein